MSLSLKNKIFIGYMVMMSLTVFVGGYAIWILQELNEITDSLVHRDINAAEKLTNLNDSILAQDLFEKRFLAFHHTEAENLFWNRSRDANAALEDLSNLDSSLKNIVSHLSDLHDKYNKLFSQEVSLIKSNQLPEAEDLSSGDLKFYYDRLSLSLKDLERQIKEKQNLRINRSNVVGTRALTIMTVLSVASCIIGVLLASLITNYLDTSIQKLKEATDIIRSGKFDNLPEIHGADELADLAISFKEMSARLKELETMNLDANPLTKLPGNLAIEKELLTRLNETKAFSFCLIDLDNFKAFSDRYGYSKGSDLLKWLGDLLIKVKAEYAAPDDFLGHIGGDDYVLICSPERVQTMCEKIIAEFDRGIVDFYDSEDVKKGFIVSLDRNDKPAVFGIMTISIAVVNTDRTLIREPKEVATKVAELKHYAKTFSKSIYVMDRRRMR